ncbi:MAG: 1-acyl-sn-glycerol-3-phosphate acyltransferase [Spirulina sp.]
MQFFQQAQPPLRFLPPQPNPTVIGVTRLLMPYWLRWRENLQRIESRNVDPLVYLMRDFQAQKHRFLLAFRHPSPQDAFCMAHLLWYDVPRRAKELGVTLDQPHAHFIYDRGIPLWAGSWVGGFYARLGGTPIQRGKLDRQGLRSARYLFAHGQWPMAAAPEGGNNGHTELVSPLEPGIAQMGFWCVSDLQEAERLEQVSILPVGITYEYTPPPWDRLDQWLDRLERETGLSVTQAQPDHPRAAAGDSKGESAGLMGLTDATMQRRYQRLLTLGEHLLGVMEDYYHRVYQMPLAAQPMPFADRLEVLRNAALQVAETYFQLPPRGTMIDRCRRIEQAGWERIFRQELGEDQPLSAVARGLADREAEESSLRMWHMRLVENFVAVTGQYVRERPTAERFAETLMIVRDIVWLIKGENPFPRPKLGPQVATVTVGEPMSVRDRWPDYQASRKQAVAQFTTDLQLALERLIPKEDAQ